MLYCMKNKVKKRRKNEKKKKTTTHKRKNEEEEKKKKKKKTQRGDAYRTLVLIPLAMDVYSLPLK